jgi:hypothetical protein
MRGCRIGVDDAEAWGFHARGAQAVGIGSRTVVQVHRVAPHTVGERAADHGNCQTGPTLNRARPLIVGKHTQREVSGALSRRLLDCHTPRKLDIRCMVQRLQRALALAMVQALVSLVPPQLVANAGRCSRPSRDTDNSSCSS